MSELADDADALDAALSRLEVAALPDGQGLPLGPGGDGAGLPGPSHRFDTTEQWVDQVYSVLAVGVRLPWCSRWWEHPEAYERLTWLWKSWEAAMVTQGSDQTSMSRWLRDHFDWHRSVLQARDGPFADCGAGHRAASARLAVTDQTPAAHGAVISQAADAFLARQQLSGPAPVDPQTAAAFQEAFDVFLDAEQERS